MSLGVLRLKPFSTPLKIANAVPAIIVLAIETVHKDNTIHVVSKRMKRMDRVSYATEASFLIWIGEKSPILGEIMIWSSLKSRAASERAQCFRGSQGGIYSYIRKSCLGSSEL